MDKALQILAERARCAFFLVTVNLVVTAYSLLGGENGRCIGALSRERSCNGVRPLLWLTLLD